MKRRIRRKNSSKKHLVFIGVFILLFLFILGLIIIRGHENKQNGTDIGIADTDVEKSVQEQQKEEVEKIISGMTLEEKVAQLFIITPETLTGMENMYQDIDVAKASVDSYPVGGLIYFSKNIDGPDSLKGEIADINQYSIAKTGIPMFISVDEEGGLVVRIANNPNFSVVTFPYLNNINSEEEAFHLGDTIGEYLKDLGFNLDFAPVADVLTNSQNQVVRNRAFSSDPNIVADLVSAEVKGFNVHNMISVLKHFPGHGNTAGDTHFGFAVTYKNLEELRVCEFLPFISGIDAGSDIVMIAHISAPNVIGNDTPCSFSNMIIEDILRKELGFNGVVITDALNMGAISNIYSSDEAAIKAINSGVDILLMPEDFNLAYNGLIDAVKNGTVKEERINEAVRKILLLKKKKLDF